MASTPDSSSTQDATARSDSSVGPSRFPKTWRGRIAILGPGLILAAGGVGAGDLISALTGSARFGMTILWAAVLGVVLKYAVVEALARLYMTTGSTILRSVRDVGRWLSALFLLFFLVMGLLYGAALSSLVGLAMRAMAPVLPVDAWSILLLLVAAAIVSIGRYYVFEKFMTGFVILAFIGVVGTAIFTVANLSDPARFTASMVPTFPSGSTLAVLAIVGGVGGTFSTATYGYYARDKGWRDTSWIPVMRFDVAVGYILTFLFAFALFTIGTEFLFTGGDTISGSQGLLALSNPIGESISVAVGWLFLGGFFITVFDSTVSGLTNLSYLLADSLRVVRDIPEEEAARYTSQNSRWFRGALAYCTLPSIVIILIGEPVFLALLYAAFGALILPLLAIVLLRHLNGKHIEKKYRNKIMSNFFLGVALLLFVGLAGQELVGLF